MRISRLNRVATGWIATCAALVMIVATSFQTAAPAVFDGAGGPPRADVRIDNFSFQPAVITVKPGTQITWTNADDIPHTVVSDSKAFKSKVLATGEKFTFTAGKAGTYPYACSIHPNMTGKVVVE
jgi:plastocyanin